MPAGVGLLFFMGNATPAPPPYVWQDRALKDGPITMRATLGAGCYWGTENYVLQWGEALGGGRVTRSAVGFSGGLKANPTYPEVCTGRTGHVEVLDVDIKDSQGVGSAVLYEDLIKYFFMFHDPTTTNRQGNDGKGQHL